MIGVVKLYQNIPSLTSSMIVTQLTRGILSCRELTFYSLYFHSSHISESTIIIYEPKEHIYLRYYYFSTYICQFIIKKVIFFSYFRYSSIILH